MPTDSTSSSAKCTSFASCCAHQRIAWTAARPDLRELQSSNICMLRADAGNDFWFVDHCCPQSDSPLENVSCACKEKTGMGELEEYIAPKRMLERIGI